MSDQADVLINIEFFLLKLEREGLTPDEIKRLQLLWDQLKF